MVENGRIDYTNEGLPPVLESASYTGDWFILPLISIV